jgi:hypothetical protein
MAGAKDNGGYDPTALGGDFGRTLQGYLNTPAPGMDASTLHGLNTIQNTAQTFQPGLNAGFNALYDQVNSGGLTPGMNQSIGYADDAASDYARLADSFSDPQNNPGYQTIRNNLSDDVRKSVYSDFGASGMFGSDSSINAAAEGLGNALGGLDYNNYQQGIQNQMGALQGQLGASGQGFGQRQQGVANTQAAAAMLPSAFAGTLLPSQTMIDVGRQREQYRDADYNRFQELLGAFTGSSGNPGMAEEAPWWQQLLGIGATGSGIFGNIANGWDAMGW